MQCDEFAKHGACYCQHTAKVQAEIALAEFIHQSEEIDVECLVDMFVGKTHGSQTIRRINLDVHERAIEPKQMTAMRAGSIACIFGRFNADSIAANRTAVGFAFRSS